MDWRTTGVARAADRPKRNKRAPRSAKSGGIRDDTGRGNGSVRGRQQSLPEPSSKFGILAPGLFRAPLSKDSGAREEVGQNRDSAGPRIASAFFVSSPPLRP